MDEKTGQEAGSPTRSFGSGPVGRHPKPPIPRVGSLNEAIRQELWYVDTMVAAPFRTLRRSLQSSGKGSALAEGLDELLWAAEGMTRLPVKILQSAFGEQLRLTTRGRQDFGHESNEGRNTPDLDESRSRRD